VSATLVSGSACAADSANKASYDAAKDAAEANYKAAKAQCKSLAGNEEDVCLAQAKAARVHDVSSAEAQYKNTPQARASARKDIADADYDVNKAKCNSLAGNDKDVCIKQAKATKTSQIADAKSTEKASEARADANDAKRDADYAVEKEKCDSFSGQAKDDCIANAKARYGK